MRNFFRFILFFLLMGLRSCDVCPAANVTFSFVDDFGNPTNRNITLTALNQPLYFGQSIAFSTPQLFLMATNQSSLTVSNMAGGDWVLAVQGMNKLLVLDVPPDSGTYSFTSITISNIAYYAKLANIFAYWPANLDQWAGIGTNALPRAGVTNLTVGITNPIIFLSHPMSSTNFSALAQGFQTSIIFSNEFEIFETNYIGSVQWQAIPQTQ